MNIQDFEIKNHVLIKYHGNKPEIVIPDSVTGIESYAFSDCQNLRKIIIPDSVRYFGKFVFSGFQNRKTAFVRYGIEFTDTYLIKDALDYMEYLKAFLEHPEDQELCQKIKEHIPFLFHIDTEHFKICLESGKIFDQEHINFFIRYANWKQLYEKQILLTNYKYQHFDFDQTGGNLKL